MQPAQAVAPDLRLPKKQRATAAAAQDPLPSLLEMDSLSA
jgi:hypothetical protein